MRCLDTAIALADRPRGKLPKPPRFQPRLYCQPRFTQPLASPRLGLDATGAREVHFSARQLVDGPMRYRKAGLSMGEEISEYARSTAERIRDAMSGLSG